MYRTRSKRTCAQPRLWAELSEKKVGTVLRDAQCNLEETTGCFNVPVWLMGTRFEAGDCISEPGPQETYRDIFLLKHSVHVHVVLVHIMAVQLENITTCVWTPRNRIMGIFTLLGCGFISEWPRILQTTSSLVSITHHIPKEAKRWALKSNWRCLFSSRS
jgi:hypothetical protein